MILIAHTLLLVAGSITLLHLFVYRLSFPGETKRREAGGFVRTFVGFTAPGYGVARLVSLYLPWISNRRLGRALHCNPG